MIDMTEKAQAKALALAEKEGKAPVLRIGVKGGGCSGFSYVLDFEDQLAPKEHDLHWQFGELNLLCDPRSVKLLDGMLIDYDTNLLSSGFTFKNPNAKKSCSCGESFAV